MTNYQPVSDALASGAEPRLLCETCPWDRLCIAPPEMTRADVDKQMADAKVKDEASRQEAEAKGERSALPISTLLTSLVYAGRDTTAQVCPVYALRLKSSAGRRLADATRAAMQSWDDQA